MLNLWSATGSLGRIFNSHKALAAQTLTAKKAEHLMSPLYELRCYKLVLREHTQKDCYIQMKVLTRYTDRDNTSQLVF